MIKLFVLGIFGWCISGPNPILHEIIKANLNTEEIHSSFQTPSLQPSTTDAIYQKLDVFIAAPNLENGDVFYQWLQTQSITTKDEYLALVISLTNLGYYARANGDYQRAIQYYSEGWNLYNSNQLSGFDILESCLKPLGNLYSQTNALSEAQQIIEIYLYRAQQAKRSDIISGGIANLSVVYQNQGNYEKAISLLQEGLKRHPNHPDLLTNLATNLLAVRRDREGLEAAQKSLNINPSQPNIYKLRAQYFAQKKQYPEAVEELRKGFDLQQKIHGTSLRDLAKTQLSLAEILVQQNELEKAKLALQNVYSFILQNSSYPLKAKQEVPDYNQLYPENTLMDALDLDAHIAFLEDDYPGSLMRYERSAYIGELLNTSQRDQQSRLIMQTNSKKRIAAYLEIAFTTYQKTKDQKVLEDAFQMSQKATASIVSATNISKKQRQLYGDDLLMKDLEKRENNQANWKVETYEYQKEGIPDLMAYTAVLDSMDQNSYQIKKINNELRVKYPTLNESENATLSEVQSKARAKKQMVVSYFMGTSATYQFIISGSEAIFNRLTTNVQTQQAFKQECIQFLSYFKDAGEINNDPNGYAKAAHLLYNKLQIPDAEELIIIPDSFLQFIPFDALLTKESASFQYENMPFLLKETSLSYALSPVLYIQEDIPMAKNPLALGIFPVFEGTPLELTHSIEESKAVSSSFNGELLMHEDATTASAFAKARNHQILHFSTHASGGSLQTPAYLKMFDTQIPVNQLYGNQWQTDLVVLSACETGIGAIVTGEGAQSLARGFQYAGVQNIAFSLWQVNDRATATLMSSFYRTLNSSRSRNESLHKAKLNYLEDTSIQNSKKSPYFWAAFVYYGTTDISQNSNSWLWWCALGILVLFLGFLLKRKHGITP